MINIKLVRSNPQIIKDLIKKRHLDTDLNLILSLDKERNELLAEIENGNKRINEIASLIGSMKKKRSFEEDEFERLRDESSKVDCHISDLKIKLEKVENDLNFQLSLIPNILDDSVPYGLDASENKVIREVGSKKKFSFKPKCHTEIGPDLGISFELVTKICGSRFAHLIDDCAILDRGIKNFMIDSHLERGFRLIQVPSLVEENAAYCSGQLPKFKDDMFRTDNGMFMLPTSEVYMANLFKRKWEKEELPIRLVALSSCYRKEAGSSGYANRGLIRQHQFDKVEMFVACNEERSDQELDFLVECGSDILKKLDIPFRVVLLCSGDTGFCASKTYDIEFFSPVSESYIEISSCSNVKNFQANRSKSRYSDDGRKKELHFLNGSGLAVGRTIVAIIENYQQEDGSVAIPDVLHKYTCGLTKLSPKKRNLV